jgi:DNA-binding CsgD family transcriptional regulator
LAASPHALFIVDAGAHVLHANPAAERLLAGRDALGVASGRLSALAAEPTQRLHALVARAAAAGERRGGSMSLASPLRQLPLPVSVAPVRAEASIAVRQEPSVLVCVTDLEARTRLSVERLREIFDLSPAEARVAAALFEGDTPREAAERLGVSFFTVRGHLVRIFEKTGVSRQAELARLLAAAGDPWLG